MEPNCVCDFCKKDIYKNKWSLKNTKNHFCNRLCHQSYTRKNTKILITHCDFCGKEIERNSQQQRRSKTGLFFCCNLCKNRYLAKNRRWLKDNVKSHHSRQDILYEKSNCTCQQCGYNEDRRMLDIHHYDHDKGNNRYENLRVLCVWCHIKHHRLGIEYDLPVIISGEEMEKEIKIFINKRMKDYFNKITTKIEITKLCPICDKNFKTYEKEQKYCSYKCSGLSHRKIERPSKEELIEFIKVIPMTEIGKKFNVSDNAVRKWSKAYEINIKEISPFSHNKIKEIKIKGDIV